MTRVLVPVAVLDGGSVSPGLMHLLGTVDVTVLGYHVLPEQTPPDQARLQYEERATSALEDLIQEFRSAGGEASYRLVFTRDREQTVDRIADEVGANAFAITGMTGDVDRVLVSLSGDVAVDRILTFVTDLIGERDIGVTLFLAANGAGGDETTSVEAERGTETDDATNSGAVLSAAADRLRDAGIDASAEAVTDRSPFDGLLDALPGHDAIVMGENAPSLRSLVFGAETDRVASASVGPVLVVRNVDTLDE